MTHDHAAHSTSRVSGFGAGVMIETAEGPIPVDWLRPGDRVLTRDRGYQPLLWTGRTRGAGLPPPVRLFAGGFGKSIPEHTLILAPGHRIMLRSPMVELHFATREVLAPADAVALEGEITDTHDSDSFAYYHMLLDAHQTVLAEGVWLESLFPNPEMLQILGPDAEAAIRKAAPDLDEWHTARMCLTPDETALIQPRSAIVARRMVA